MRLTIARKIALAVTAIVILCVGTMAWVTSSNLQRGFVAYLNEMQTQDLDQLRELLEARYRREGNFEWLRRQPRALKSVLDEMQPRVLFEADGRGRPRPEPEPAPGYPAQDGGVPEPTGYGAPQTAPNRDAQAPAQLRPELRPGSQPESQSESSPESRPDSRRDSQPDSQPDSRPEFRGEAPPPRRAYGMGPPPRDGRPPRPRAPEPAPPANRAPPPPTQRDPMGFASRISIVDAQGRTLIGPPDFPPGIERDIKVDGVVVGRMRLLPLRQASGVDASATGFLREQLQAILLLSCGLIALAVLAAIWLARHLLRPVDALRDVTARLARGQFDARAPLLSRDELAELALHVNAMAQALQESEQRRRSMLADISHELRTPLTVIRGEIEALLDGIRKADAHALASLHAEVLRLNKLVDDLYQLTLADAGDLKYQWQRVDLVELLLPVLERYQPRARKAGLELSWRLPSAPLMLDGDANRLTQVIVNLLENSVRYTDGGGRIVVSLSMSSSGRHADLAIDDSAPGVPDGAHARIFERLYRVDGARTRARGGSGLGLAICKVLVEAHGGSIVALPSRLGGLHIEMRLPLQAPQGKNTSHG